MLLPNKPCPVLIRRVIGIGKGDAAIFRGHDIAVAVIIIRNNSWREVFPPTVFSQ
jgi:hypothetical protein